MQSKLLSSQFLSEIDSYKPPPQYLYFLSNKQWACSACTIFSLFASVNFNPCLQEINLWTFILSETAIELYFGGKLQLLWKEVYKRLISDLTKYCQHLTIKMLKIMLMWKQSVTGARCGLRCALNSQHIQKQTSLWTEPLWDAENTGSRAASARMALHKQAWWRESHITLSPFDALRKQCHEATLKTFYVIMKSINIFSGYYETVAGQIRLWRAATDYLMNGKHWYTVYKSESESEWALLARYVYTYEKFVKVTKLHSATEWQQQDRTQTTKEQYTNRQCTK